MLEKFQRPLLIVGVALTGYLLLLQWQADYSPEAQSAVQQAPSPSIGIESGGIESNPQAEVDLPTTADIDELTQELLEVPAEQQELEVAAGEQSEQGQQGQQGITASSDTYILVTSDKFNLYIDRRGGDIVRAELRDYKEIRKGQSPLLLLRNDNQRFSIAQSGLIGRDGFDATVAGRPVYSTAKNEYVMAEGAQSLTVPLTYSKDGVEVVKSFILQRGRHDIDVVFRVNNRGVSDWYANMFAQFRRDDQDPTYDLASFGTRSFTGAAFTSEDDNYNKLDFGDMEKRDLKLETKGGWVAMVQHYFMATWIPQDSNRDYVYSTRATSRGDYIFGFTAPVFLARPGESKEEKLKLYAGPKSQKPLKALAPNLALTIDYGWLWYISQPLFQFLDFIHSYVKNWGLAIIIMTFIIKMVFYPLTNASYKSMARMKKLQPQMMSIRESHSGNRKQMQEEMMKLYKREKVNPMGGCLPILIQMPIFISFYWALIESVELRHAPLIWWIQDLASQDPYFILPLLMGISMFVQQLFSPAPPDPTQAKIMKMLPVIFTVFFLWFPAGLVLYWLVNNILSIMQQYIINRRLGTLHTPNINFDFLKLKNLKNLKKTKEDKDNK